MNHPLAKIVAAVALIAAIVSPAAQAQNISNDQTLAMLNSSTILNYLSGIHPSIVNLGLENIEKRLVKRNAPEFPIWILESSTSTILYYEGQPSFAGKPAGKLIDEDGQRFGVKALESSTKSRSGWQRIKLGGVVHQMFCGQKYPFAVCTLIPARELKNPD